MRIRNYSIYIFLGACFLLLLTGLFSSPLLIFFTASATALLVVFQAILILQDTDISQDEDQLG